MRASSRLTVPSELSTRGLRKKKTTAKTNPSVVDVRAVVNRHANVTWIDRKIVERIAGLTKKLTAGDPSGKIDRYASLSSSRPKTPVAGNIVTSRKRPRFPLLVCCFADRVYIGRRFAQSLTENDFANVPTLFVGDSAVRSVRGYYLRGRATRNKALPSRRSRVIGRCLASSFLRCALAANDYSKKSLFRLRAVIIGCDSRTVIARLTDF